VSDGALAFGRARISPALEWLEADGLGGFASGTAALERTRRYHALLLAAKTPPTGRVVLVNGYEAELATPEGVFALSSQRYAPDVVAPDGAAHLVHFEAEPWPRWTFALPGGRRIEHELFVPHGAPAIALAWRACGGPPQRAPGAPASQPSGAPAQRACGGPEGLVLRLRLLVSGRDYHALQHENAAFRFAPESRGDALVLRPYDGVPGIRVRANARFVPAPLWYRRFLYLRERERGLDALEDLAAPGVLEFELGSGEACLLLAAELPTETGLEDDAPVTLALDRLRARERARRTAFATPLARAADVYLVRRGEGRSVIAGYPWFTDWGRDSFVSLRGLCLATGRLDDAREILLTWAGSVSEGLLPNRFADAGDAPEYDAVDASLWYVIAVHACRDALARAGRPLGPAHAKRLDEAVAAILDGFVRGTRHAIRCDADGLVACGEPGVALTWMDARVDGRVITPRWGKPVEVQALWVNALRLASAREPRWRPLAERAGASFGARFWNDARGCLYDVVDCEGRPGANDDALRPNQIFAVGGLPLALLEGERARRVVELAEAALVTPLGLRSLAPGEPGYAGRYRGGVVERDGAYHQGTAWPWLLGPFVEAWLRVRGSSAAAKREARVRFLAPLTRHRCEAGLGHVSEIADGDAPHAPAGCPFQAWSLAEWLRLDALLAEGDA